MYVQMELICTSPVLIGLLFTAERVTEGIIGISLANLPQRLGRRKTILTFLGLNLLSQTILIFCPWFYARMFGYAVFGVSSLKNSCAYTWLFECMETKNKSRAVTFLNMVDLLTMIVLSLYVLFVSRSWFYLCFTMYCVGVINWLTIYFAMPESPKWLLTKGRTQQAHLCFEAIANLNGV